MTKLQSIFSLTLSHLSTMKFNKWTQFNRFVFFSQNSNGYSRLLKHFICTINRNKCDCHVTCMSKMPTMFLVKVVAVVCQHKTTWTLYNINRTVLTFRSFEIRASTLYHALLCVCDQCTDARFAFAIQSKWCVKATIVTLFQRVHVHVLN